MRSLRGRARGRTFAVRRGPEERPSRRAGSASRRGVGLLTDASRPGYDAAMAKPSPRLRQFLFGLAVAAAVAGVLTVVAGSRDRVPPVPAGGLRPSAESPQALFDGHGDIGAVKRAGTIRTDKDGAVVIEGAGANMWFANDEGHFAWRTIRGDFIVSARAAFKGRGVEAHRKIGWMARSTSDSGSAQASAVVHGDGLTSLQYRRTPGADTEEIRMPVTAADEIQLERRGSTFIMSAARFGEPVERVKVEGLDLGEEALVGLFVCSHNADVVEAARFTNVRFIRPSPADFVPYRDYLGGTIEILDVETGRRTAVFRSDRPIQAPNWSRDGRSLLYNVDGRIDRLELSTGRTATLDTGFATDNNNDHVLSFDGRRLGLSHHSPDDGGESVIFTVPAEGGTPTRVTAKAPSYLHGWSPDGRFLVYTGGRDGNFDIYRIPIEGGPEVRLTEAPGLDDGPEYTPDGRFVYFDSARTGAMRIWRMRPDGSGQEPVTDGLFHDWFPHVSPDGKRLVFLSFGKDVAADDHPFYRQVYLRMMPLDGSAAPTIVAYVYGGQGTINVPSWSPDSRRVAFVSNSR
jgi:TolB protein